MSTTALSPSSSTRSANGGALASRASTCSAGDAVRSCKRSASSCASRRSGPRPDSTISAALSSQRHWPNEYELLSVAPLSSDDALPQEEPRRRRAAKASPRSPCSCRTGTIRRRRRRGSRASETWSAARRPNACRSRWRNTSERECEQLQCGGSSRVSRLFVRNLAPLRTRAGRKCITFARRRRRARPRICGLRHAATPDRVFAPPPRHALPGAPRDG